jgi:hypothetical protein
MAEAYATVADYEAWTGQQLDEPAAARVTMRLAAASALIRAQLPNGYTPDADVARSVTLTVVERAMVNPGGRRSITMGGYSETLDQNGGLYLTDAERDQILAGYDGEGGSGAYTVGLRDEAYPPHPHDHAWHVPRPGAWC